VLIHFHGYCRLWVNLFLDWCDPYDGWLNQSFRLILCWSISMVAADCEPIYSLIGVILMMVDWINLLDWLCVDPFPWLLQIVSQSIPWLVRSFRFDLVNLFPWFARVTQSFCWSWWSSCFFSWFPAMWIQLVIIQNIIS